MNHQKTNRRPPTIWLNVTTSVNWESPPVGIIRTEQILRAELKSIYKSQLKECIWNKDHFQCYQSSLSLKASPIIKLSANNARYQIVGKKQALKRICIGIISLAPLRLRPFMGSLAALVSRTIKKLSKKKIIDLFLRNRRIKSCFVKQKGENKATFPLKKHTPDHPFSSGDIFISIGMDWREEFYMHLDRIRKSDNIKVVTACYDLIPCLYPQYMNADVEQFYRHYFQSLAKGSDLILCISKHTQSDLNKFVQEGRPEEVAETAVITLGDSIPILSNEPISNDVKDLAKSSYILYVSSIDTRKNHEVLYRAYHIICSKGKKSELPKMVFVGMQGGGIDHVLRSINLDPSIKGLFTILNNVNDSELRTLYEQALFCVYPSLYEGWGLPVGEALSLGKVVISSGTSSLPEVGGKLAFYADPWSPNEWADKIQMLLEDKYLIKEQEEKIRTQYKPRDWDRTALDIANALKRHLESEG